MTQHLTDAGARQIEQILSSDFTRKAEATCRLSEPAYLALRHRRGPVGGAWRCAAIDVAGALWQNNVRRLRVIESVAHYAPAWELWHHVSVSHRERMPLRAEMAMVKNLFVGRAWEAYEVWPSEDRYVNHDSRVLHLWARLDVQGGRVLPDFRVGGTI